MKVKTQWNKKKNLDVKIGQAHNRFLVEEHKMTACPIVYECAYHKVSHSMCHY